MKTRLNPTALLLLCVLSLAAAFYQAVVIRRLQVRITAMQAAETRTISELDSLHRQSEAAQKNLESAKQDLVKASPATAIGDPDREREMTIWLAKLKQLRDFFRRRPEQQIPQMSLLTDEDWLKLSRTAELDSDKGIRKALAAVRYAAKSKFFGPLSKALQSYLKNSDGVLPPNVSALAPYFETPIDPTMLEQYVMARSGKASDVPSYAFAIQEKAAVDEDFDMAINFQPQGGGQDASGPAAWILDFPTRLNQAREAYAHENKGPPSSGLAPLLPYFNPPLNPTTGEKLLKAERASSH